MSSIVNTRVLELRNKLEIISSNRSRLNFLKNYYRGKTAIVIATGPGFQDYVDLIRDNINNDTIIICVKQSLRCFDHEADFHVINRDHLEEYEYNELQPITIMVNHPCQDKHPYGDIQFFSQNTTDIDHQRFNSWDQIDLTNYDSLSWNDKNLGTGENMVFNGNHIMLEAVMPLCVHLGVKNIIMNGWVGGGTHGIYIKDETDWNSLRHLWSDDEKMKRISEKIPGFLKEHFDINIYTICDSKFKIKRITDSEYVDIVKSK
jgi:hypothetical protein